MKRVWRSPAGALALVIIVVLLLISANIALNLPWIIYRTDEIGDKQRAIQNGVNLLDNSGTVMVIASHPDEPACFIGGTLAELKRSNTNVILVITVGPGKNGKKTEKELTSIFLNHPDGLKEADADVLESEIYSLYQEYEPNIVLTFDPGYTNWLYKPTEHGLTGRAAVVAAEQLEIPGVYGFFSSKPDTCTDIHSVLVSKSDAITSLNSGIGMVPDFILRFYVEKTARVEGSKAGLAYGETFRKLK